MSISNFVIEQLDKIASKEGFIDYVIERAPGSNHGDGFIATMLAVSLVGKRKIGNEISDSKLQLMCKCLPKNVDRCETFDTSTIFEREAYIYNKVLTAFDEFQREKNIPVEDRFTEYPKCYAAISDMEKNEHVIIMENLKSVGYDLWDKTKSIDYETVCLYMKALGKLHALSFALRDQKPNLFDELTDFEDIFIKIVNKNDMFIKMLEAGCDKAFSLLNQPDELKVMQNFKNHCKDECIRLLDKALAGNFYVLGHGDSWNNNMFYLNGGSSTPQKICLLDWQISRCASPGLDITYYLMSSTNKQVRARYEDLLKVYHNSLSNFMRKLGSDPNKWFTFEDLIDQLKTVGSYGVLMATCLLQVMIESLDDHSGRLLIKLALGGTKEWFNEFMVQPVSKAEYAQYGKVINSAKYEEYKKKQEEKERLNNLKTEKLESSSNKSSADRQDRSRKVNSRSSDDERCRVGSSDSRKQRSNRDRHSGNSNDEDKHSVRTSKSNSYKKRDSSEDSTHSRSKSYSSCKQSTRKEIHLSSDENDRSKHSSSHKSSHKKTKSKKHFKSRSYSKDHRQRYNSSDEDEKHHKKKTKKSKRPRSRSRDNRR